MMNKRLSEKMLLSKIREMPYSLSASEGYDIGIAAEFVLQLIKMSSNQYRSCTTGKDGPGGI
jgi:hypothetical protein